MKKIFKILVAIVVIIGIIVACFYSPDIPVEKLKAKYCDAQSKFIKVDGMDVHYKIEGKGFPVVLIHGTGSILQTWDTWTDSLRNHYTVIRMDIPAFGITGPNPTGIYSTEMYVTFIDDFVKAIGVDSFDLGGNSLGGLIAWEYALAQPQKVKKLVLVDPAGFYDTTQAPVLVFRLAQKQWLAPLLSHLGTGMLVKKTLRDVYADDSKITKAQIEMYTDINRRTGNRMAFIKRQYYLSQTREHAEDLPRITAPTLVMWGTEDLLIPVGMAENFKKIPNAEFKIYDNVGHSAQEEIGTQSVQDAMEFLGK